MSGVGRPFRGGRGTVRNRAPERVQENLFILMNFILKVESNEQTLIAFEHKLES